MLNEKPLVRAGRVLKPRRLHEPLFGLVAGPKAVLVGVTDPGRCASAAPTWETVVRGTALDCPPEFRKTLLDVGTTTRLCRMAQAQPRCLTQTACQRARAQPHTEQGMRDAPEARPWRFPNVQWRHSAHLLWVTTDPQVEAHQTQFRAGSSESNNSHKAHM